MYNTAGQLVKVLLDHDRDVSVLSKGVYFLKITTDKGVETTKVTK
ncbi:T9SS type A sorting domain-containing protein [Bergeyella zoohelcum]|nr:T9SS type A sorting domain-containing protein [Bergeyella zoohelcum]